MCGGVGEQVDDLHLLDERARPSVADDQRQRVLVLGANVDEVDVQPVDLGDELRHGVQPRLALAPVVLGLPVARDRLDRRQLHTLRRIVDSLLLGPARRRDAGAQVLELRLGDVDCQRPDRCGVRSLFGRACHVVPPRFGDGDGTKPDRLALHVAPVETLSARGLPIPSSPGERAELAPRAVATPLVHPLSPPLRAARPRHGADRRPCPSIPCAGRQHRLHPPRPAAPEASSCSYKQPGIRPASETRGPPACRYARRYERRSPHRPRGPSRISPNAGRGPCFPCASSSPLRRRSRFRRGRLASANRWCADARFAMAKQPSEKGRPAHLLLVRSESPGALAHTPPSPYRRGAPRRQSRLP